MPYAAALSVHPVTATAVGEAAGQLLEDLGPEPDLAVVFVTPHHAGALEDVGGAVDAVLGPRVTFGCAAAAVVGTNREVEDEPGVALWAGRLNGPVAPFDPGGAPPPFEPQALLLVADPYTFDAEALFAAHPGLTVIGGNASAAAGPGGNRLLSLGGRVANHGAVGAWLGPGVSVEPVVSQGCRPIGNPYVVTRAERNVIYELAGRPALERLLEMVESGTIPAEDVRLVNRGLHLGQVVDEHKETFGRGDFLIRNVLGADRENGAIAVGDVVDVGRTVQFHVRDAATADEDLATALRGRWDRTGGVLVFTCNGRGKRFFGEPHHDARTVDQWLEAPAAGFFAAGEFGPVGGRTFVHGFTASLALFRD